MSLRKCRSIFRGLGKEGTVSIQDVNICADSSVGDTCQGDSGGPLTVQHNGVHTLAGITSHGLSEIPHIKVDYKRRIKQA